MLFLTAWTLLSPRVSPSLYSDSLFRPDWGVEPMDELQKYNKFENHELFFSARDGAKLHGWLFLNDRPGSTNKIFLFHPGNAGNIAKRLPLIEYLLESGASVFVYEPRGFGLSPGKPSIYSIIEDGETAYDHLIAIGYKPSQIVLYGESLGAAVATHVSTVRTVDGIILQSGFESLERIGKEQFPALRLYPSWMFHHHRLDNAALMAKPHAPLLILHGDKDTLIDVTHGEGLYRKAVGPKQFVRFPNSGHSDVTTQDLQMFIRAVSDFIRSHP